MDVQHTRAPIPPTARAGLVLVAAGQLALLLAVAGRYGYHRDELYFLACGRHPAWGYPDQPPLTPLLARAMDALGDGSLVVFRLPAALAAVAVTVLTGLIARDLGGRRFAQVLAALTAATGAFVLISGHMLLTSTIDLAIWVGVLWAAVHALRTGDRRWWLLAGAVAGLGLLNKQLVLILLAGLALGLVLAPSGRWHLRSGWLWAGAAIAVAAWAPVVAWQARNGWPQLTLAAQIRAEYGTPEERLNFVLLQVVMFSLGATALWLAGLVRLWRDPAWRDVRVLAWVWLVALLAVALTAGQGYYTAGTYVPLIAAGAVVVERHVRLRRVAVGAVVVTSALTLPAALPVLPAETLGRSVWSELGEVQRESAGWPELVDLVAEAYRTIPPERRAGAGIVTANYGEAGAIDRYGPSRGLPRAWSGHNAYGLWGPPPEGTAPLVVVWEGSLHPAFTGCRLHAKVTGPVPNEETEWASVYVCDGPVGAWRDVWPAFRHLSA